MSSSSTRFEKFMQIPFVDGGRDFAGADCWGLICLIMREHRKVVLPTYDTISAEALADVNKAVLSDRLHNIWCPVPIGEELPYDVVVMNAPARFSGQTRMALVHVGLVTKPGFLLHTEKSFGVSMVPFRGANAHQGVKGRVREIYRYIDV